MAQDSYIAFDLRTGVIAAELPLQNVFYTTLLNGAGELRGELPMASPKSVGIDLAGAAEPARTGLVVDRDGVLVWGGLIWTDDFHASAGAWAVAGLELWSYFRHRLISDTKTYTAVDQLAIAQALVNYAQAKTGGNVNVAVGAETSGVNRDRTYYGDEFKPIGQSIEELGAVEQGFDFAIDPVYDGSGNITFPLHLSYPRRGRVAPNTGLVFQYPGNVTDFRYPRDGTEMAVTSYTVGSGTDQNRPQVSSSLMSLIDDGYPLLDHSDVIVDDTSIANLTAHAVANEKARGGVVVHAELKVRGDQDPIIGSYVTGDDARVILTHPVRFPGPSDSLDGLDHSLDTYLRILGIQVTPRTEEVMLTMGPILV